MRRYLLALALCFLPSVAFAQGNPQCPTRPLGDSTNACASTAFVQQNIAANARIKLTANTNFYVSVAGGGTCLTALSPCTLFAVGQLLSEDYDLAGFQAIVNLADGTYTQSIAENTYWVGAGRTCSVVFKGNNTTWDAVLIQPAASYGMFGTNICVQGISFDMTNSAADTIGIAQGGVFGIGDGTFPTNCGQLNNPPCQARVNFRRSFNGGFNHVTCAFNSRLEVFGSYRMTGSSQTKTVVSSGSTTTITLNNVTNLVTHMGIDGTNIDERTYVASIDVGTNTISLSTPMTGAPSGTLTFWYPGQTHVNCAQFAQVYYNTNGQPGLIGVDIVGKFYFTAGFINMNQTAANIQAVNFTNNTVLTTATYNPGVSVTSVTVPSTASITAGMWMYSGGVWWGAVVKQIDTGTTLTLCTIADAGVGVCPAVIAVAPIHTAYTGQVTQFGTPAPMNGIRFLAQGYSVIDTGTSPGNMDGLGAYIDMFPGFSQIFSATTVAGSTQITMSAGNAAKLQYTFDMTPGFRGIVARGVGIVPGSVVQSRDQVNTGTGVVTLSQPATASGTVNVEFAGFLFNGGNYLTFGGFSIGSGTVTSVAMTAPSQFTVTGSPITGAGTLAVTLTSSTGTGAVVLANQPTMLNSASVSGTAAFARILDSAVDTRLTSTLSSTLGWVGTQSAHTFWLTAGGNLRWAVGPTTGGFYSVDAVGGDMGANTINVQVGYYVAGNALAVTHLANIAANTMVGNWTGSSAAPAANSMPSCPDTGGNHLNYVSGTGITCGTSIGNAITALTSDVTATGPGSVAATIAANAVSNAKFRQSAGLSLVGRSANTTGDVADITGSANGQILAITSNAVGFTATPTIGSSFSFSDTGSTTPTLSISGSSFTALNLVGGAATFQALVSVGLVSFKTTSNHPTCFGANNKTVFCVDGVMHERVTGEASSTPALSSCGTDPVITGTDIAGEVTMGTGTPTGCIITFANAYSSAPYCVVTWQATPLVSQSYVTSTTAITLTQTATSSNKVNYRCNARSGG